MKVQRVQWPAEAARLEDLRGAGVPRLLLLDATTAAPVVVDDLEDWIRLPALRADVDRRCETLVARLMARRRPAPVVDSWGVLAFAGGEVVLTPLEARLARVLADNFGRLVGRESLNEAGWPEGFSGRNTLDVHILRLRRRFAEVGLVIRTVRSRGYLLDLAATSTASTA